MKSPAAGALRGFVRALLFIGLFIGIAFSSPGCVERVLIVRTEPPHSRVLIDGRDMGNGPVTVPFLYYGSRQIEVRRPGYRTKVELVPLDPPWWQVPPLDFFSELLDPRYHRLDYDVFVRLEVLGDRSVPPESIQRRARQLEALANQSLP